MDGIGLEGSASDWQEWKGSARSGAERTGLERLGVARQERLGPDRHGGDRRGWDWLDRLGAERNRLETAG